MAHMKSFTAKGPFTGNRHPSTIWVTFKKYAGEDVGRGNVIFEFITKSSREFSHVVRTSSTGRFLNEVECVVRLGEEHTFVLHKLEVDNIRSLKIDDIDFSVSKTGRSLIHFSLDLHAIIQSIVLSRNGRITKTVSSSEGYSVTFDASLTDPLCMDEEEVSSVTSFLGDSVDTEGSTSSSQVDSLDSRQSWSSPSNTHNTQRGLKVRFDKEIHEIPTTKQLQEEIQQAAEERSKLSKSVGDLSLQLFQMKHEMRDIKESLRQVTELFALETKKQDIRAGKESRGRVVKRRRVVLDGNVIAKAYGDGTFRTEGIEIALDYYLGKDINAVAVVSESKVLERAKASQNGRHGHDEERLKHLIDRGLVSMTPSQMTRGFYILKYALEQNADVISNESFRNVVDSQMSKSDRKMLRSFLGSHRIPFIFIGGKFVPHPESSQLSSSPHSSKTIERSDTM